MASNKIYIIHKKTICGMDDNLSCGINSSTPKLDSFGNNPIQRIYV
jgi:hypothetical protein